MESKLTSHGFEILPNVVSQRDCTAIANHLDGLLREQNVGVIRSQNRRHVGGRNLQSTWSGWRAVIRNDRLQRFLTQHLGERFGLVRILFFDKPPQQSWNLSLHRDRAIAVSRHHQPPEPYGRPNHKAGVPHVHANDSLLEQMLTLRLHLDAMHAGNGPLTVVPRSHRNRDQPAGDAMAIHCGRGDVFAMRPLLLHGSRSSAADNTDHRRVVHLEIAPDGVLSAPYRWFRYDEASILPVAFASPPNTPGTP
ncbi:MAG: phytanoyl-CoA dioxygenase family protein [Planctomycetota bacterium]